METEIVHLDTCYSINDLPKPFRNFSESLKRVTRPIYNEALVRYKSKMRAIMTAKAHLAARGIQDGEDIAFPHEEAS